MDEQAIKEFWQGHPCGDAQVGGLRDRFHGDYDRFFTDYDQFRYRNERHLPACIDALNVADKKVLEIGLGEGAESERLIRQGAHWSGVDLTAEAVERVRTRLTLRELPYRVNYARAACSTCRSQTTASTWCSAMASCITCQTIKQAQKRDPPGTSPGRRACHHGVRSLVAELSGVHRHDTPRRPARGLPVRPGRDPERRSLPRERWPRISPTPGTRDWPVTCAWRSSSTTTPTGPPTRTPWCTTVGA